jgi:c-di-GMP-related signal transduction protein
VQPVPALSDSADGTWTVHVARQPITNRAGELKGYELLFRDSAGATSSTERAAAATSRVLVNTFSEFGLERLVGDRLGFVNLTREFLVGELPLPFAPELAVLEVLETVEVDDAVVAGVAALTGQGFAIALDDFVWGTSHDRLFGLASYIKLEVNGVDPDVLAERVAECRRRRTGLRLIAERLESEGEYRRARDLGFDLFQGYLLGRPETMSVEALAPSRVRQLELLGLLTSPDADLTTLASAIASDPSLALRILRATNSASAGQKRRIASIKDAVVILGLERLRQWLAVMVVSDLAQVGEADLSIPMVRGRWCQNLAEQAELPPDVGFTLGLLSGVADLLGIPPAELAGRLPLTDEVADALINGEGRLGAMLAAVRAYEAGAELGGGSADPPRLQALAQSYLEALDWSVATATALR